MIIPIGHAETEVRRLPWVSFAIVAICLVAFLATDVPSSESDSWLDERALDEATDYWLQHAYLEPRYEILDEVTYHLPDEQVDAFVAGLRDGNPGPSQPELFEAEQDELDRLSEAALQLHMDGSPDNDFKRWGLTPTQPSIRTLLSHQFMHAGWLHLLSNMFLLLLAAPAIEDRWGRPLFAVFYLLAGVAAGIFYTVVTPSSSIPMVGASGAIAGVLGAFLVRYWSTRINFAYFFFFGFRWIRGTFQSPAWVMIPLWFGTELFQAWLFHSAGLGNGVAYGAHVGGFLFGVAAALLVSTLKLEQRFIHSAIESKVTLMEGNPVLEQALEARENGDMDGAFALLRDECERSPEDADLAVAFWDTAVAARRPEAASPTMLRTIERATARREFELAARYWSDLSDVLPTALADPKSLVRMLPAIQDLGVNEKVVLALRQAVDPRNHGLTAGMALRIIEQARELDPPSALQAAQSVLRFEGIHENKRKRLEDLIENLEADGVELPEIQEAALALADADPALAPEWEKEPSIPLEGEAGPAVSLAGAADAQTGESAEAVAGPRALSIEGSLIDDEAGAALALDPAEELRIDPSAELDTHPVAQFGLEPGTELGGDDNFIDAELVAGEAMGPDAKSTSEVAESHFGATEDVVLGLDPSEMLPAAGALSIGLAKPSAPESAPTLPPPLPSSTPPPLPPAAVDSEPQELPVSDAIADDELRALIEIPRFSGVKAVEAVPKEFADDGIVLTVNEGRKARIEYSRIQAIAVAAVAGLAKNPVVVIDLVLNWNDANEATLRVVRLRSDRFDPRSLVSAESQLEAFRAVLEELSRRTHATPLPSAEAALARSICKKPDLATYEREVLRAG